MKDLLSKEEFFLPKPGNILTGTVISVSKANTIIDLGLAGIGIVYPGEFYDNPDRMRTLKPGDQVSAMLLELENEDGYRELSLRAAQATTAWQDIKEKKETGDILTTPIININKGGLIVEVSGIQGFLPLSQLSSEHYPKVDGGDTTKIVQALQKFKGQLFKVKILDFNEAENKLIVSERAIQEEAAKEELAKLSVGQTIEGDVTEVTDFGAFVKLSDTLDGLIHSSEIDWKFIEDPREVLHPGDHVEAQIISLDGGRVSLSLKALKDDPWLTIDEKYQVGQKVKGKISKIRNSGAFVELSGDIVGFVPVAELGGQTPQEALEAGKEYDMAIVHIDAKEHKLTLTLDKS
ncbi:MAG TPA: S1 RNA-binding domain-containing protein [Candidatus Paceibacterota bacterium]|nr:S1 RNA-binding domain-containing protein [Candidatus Paceibacterota bacterium]